MRSRPRARLSVDERRSQLLDLGRRLFNARPYDAISIDEIAAAAGISKGLLYHYFPEQATFLRRGRPGRRRARATPDGRPSRARTRRPAPRKHRLVSHVRREERRRYGTSAAERRRHRSQASAIVEGTRRAMVDRSCRASASPKAAPRPPGHPRLDRFLRRRHPRLGRPPRRPAPRRPPPPRHRLRKHPSVAAATDPARAHPRAGS